MPLSAGTAPLSVRNAPLRGDNASLPASNATRYADNEASDADEVPEHAIGGACDGNNPYSIAHEARIARVSFRRRFAACRGVP
jgi:hypothetical protein